MTSYGLSFHSTWQITLDEGCDQGTLGKYDWEVWQYDCISGTALPLSCRECWPANWDDLWGNPNSTPNAATAGDPSFCE